jgi:predicted PurR-regulated permease PerM
VVDEQGQKTNITISTGTLAKAAVIVLIFLFLYAVKDILLVVLTAIVIASAVEPMTLWLCRYKFRRLPAVIVIYISTTLIFSGIFLFFVPSLVSDTANFLSSTPRYLDSVTLWNPTQDALSGPKAAIKDISADVSQGSQTVQNLSADLSLKSFFGNLSRLLSNASEGAFRIISLIFGGVFSFILIVVLSFYLAVQKDGISNFLRVITPVKYEGYVIDLWKRVQLKIGYWMQGQMFLGLLVGAIVYPVLLVFGINNALFLAAIAAVFEVIPLFGPILSAIPAILIAYSVGGLTKALLIAGAYTIIQQFENHIFYPLVVKKIVGVPPILVILAMIVGGKLAGFLGIILSVPVATMILEGINDLQKSKLARR